MGFTESFVSSFLSASKAPDHVIGIVTVSENIKLKGILDFISRSHKLQTTSRVDTVLKQTENWILTLLGIEYVSSSIT